MVLKIELSLNYFARKLALLCWFGIFCFLLHVLISIDVLFPCVPGYFYPNRLCLIFHDHSWLNGCTFPFSAVSLWNLNKTRVFFILNHHHYFSSSNWQIIKRNTYNLDKSSTSNTISCTNNWKYLLSVFTFGGSINSWPQSFTLILKLTFKYCFL